MPVKYYLGNTGTGLGGGYSLNDILQATPDSQAASLPLSNPGVTWRGTVTFQCDLFTVRGLNSGPFPEATLASPAAPGNIDNGTRSYVYTYVGSADGETTVSDVSSGVTITDKTVNGQIDVLVPPSDDPGVVSAFLYADINHDGNFQLVSVVTPGVVFRDNFSNAELIAQSPPATNQTGNVHIDHYLTVDGNARVGGSITGSGGDILLTSAATGSTINSLTLRPHVGVDTFGLKIAPVESGGGNDFAGDLLDIYKFKIGAQTLVLRVDDFGNATFASGSARFTDITNAGGIDVLSTTIDGVINTVATSTVGSLFLQTTTFTPGNNHVAVKVNTTWSAADFTFRGVSIRPTQQGSNNQTLIGLSVGILQTGVGTLANAQTIEVLSPNIGGTLTSQIGLQFNNQGTAGGTNSTAINILNQSGATNTRAITIVSTGVTNAFVWGSSALQYANSANNIRFTDSSNTRGIDFGFTSGGSQTISSISNNGLILGAASDKLGFFAKAPVIQQASGADLTNSVTSGGTSDIIADFSNLTVYATDAATIRNDIYQLARKLKQVNDALRLYGILN